MVYFAWQHDLGYSFSKSSNYSYIYLLPTIDIPGVVDNTTVVRMLLSLTSVKLTWDQPEDNNAQIASYNIIYCTSDSDGSCVDQTPTTISVPTTEPMAVLENLVPVRTYRVYIQAENDAGLGPQSQPYFFDSANEGMLIVSHSRILHSGSHSRVVWWHVCVRCWHLA